MTKGFRSTPNTQTSQVGSFPGHWSEKYGSPSQETGLYRLPYLELITDDLLLCGGSLRKLVQEVSNDQAAQETLAAQILLAVDGATDEIKTRWHQITSIGTKAKLIMGKDKMLDEWSRGSLKQPTVLQSVARNVLPEIFGKEREPKQEGPTEEQKKLIGHIKDLVE